MNNIRLSRHIQSSRGAALITALMILLVLTIIGISALRTSSLQETIVGNLRDQDLAFQAAESAIIDAEDKLDKFINPPQANSSGTKGIYTRDSSTVGGLNYNWANSAANTSIWDNDVATEFGVKNTKEISEVNADPMYVIQEEIFAPNDLDPETRAQGLGRFTYKITSRGEGKADTTVTLVQETFAKQYR
jgi:type IV pilus assembly protein PilX